MKSILLTGFEPFSDIQVNPSESLVKDLHDQLGKDSTLQVHSMILPVDYEKAGGLIDTIDFSKFDFVFEFGVAAARTKISLERLALNWIESSIPDNAGRIYQSRPISKDAKDAIFNGLDLQTICRVLNLIFPNSAEVSFSAGGYLCNFVYFKSLQKSNSVLFIHIPLNYDRHKLKEIANKIIEETLGI